ncbi:MAG: Bsp6I family type II restriction endonuclease [Chlamydiia bacterium]|nr:Bsp6I family type II restriction endonuclease [Chlamydiia bacterium]
MPLEFIDEIQDYLFIYSTSDMKNIQLLWKKWCECNAVLELLGFRKFNVPSVISEALVCIYLKSCGQVVPGKTKRGKSFDCIDFRRGKNIQVKASSIENDLSSFGPRSTWDELYFVHISRITGEYKIFFIEIDFTAIQLGKGETFISQQQQGRRPRFSIMSKIREFNINHLYSGNIDSLLL